LVVSTERLGISPTAPFRSSTITCSQRLQQTITAYFLPHRDTNNSVFKIPKLRTISVFPRDLTPFMFCYSLHNITTMEAM